MPGERTEQATQHRREKARKEGDILHSRELSAAAGTLAGVMTLGLISGRTMEAWRGAFEGFLSLGAAARWEPATMEPTLVAMRRLMLIGARAPGRGDGDGGRGGAGSGHCADRRGELLRGRDRIQAGAHQSGGESEEPVFAARRGKAGEVAASGQPSGCLCRAADRHGN